MIYIQINDNSAQTIKQLQLYILLKVIVTTQEGVPQEIPYQHIVTTTQQVS